MSRNDHISRRISYQGTVTHEDRHVSSPSDLVDQIHYEIAQMIVDAEDHERQTALNSLESEGFDPSEILKAMQHIRLKALFGRMRAGGKALSH